MKLFSSYKATNDLRAHLKASLAAILENKELGFHSLPLTNAHWDEAFSHSENLKSKGFSKYIVLGMGGSNTGGKALVHAEKAYSTEVDFWDSIDPIFLEAKSQQIDWNTSHFIAISKSGSTLETLELLKYCTKKLQEKKIETRGRFTVITEESDSALRKFGMDLNAYFLNHPKDVGGRFSALTVVGLLPLALCSERKDSPLKEAANLIYNKELIIEFANNILSSWQKEKWISVFWSYDERLRFFGPWIQQIWAESLAQANKKDLSKNPFRVSTPYPILGSQAQHSVLQQFVEGHDDKLIIIIDSLQDTNTYIKKMNDALAQSFDEQIDYLRISDWNCLELMYFFELVIACIGEFMQINPFIQPGVEKAKVIARNLIEASSIES